MRYKLLGKSGLRVSEICLGAMTFGEEWGWGAPKDESRKIFEAYAEAGGNFIDGLFQVNAAVEDGLDHTKLWTRGGIFSGTGGVTYLISKHTAFTVDAFYSPLWVKRSPTARRTNDGLFNVRALVSYSFH